MTTLDTEQATREAVLLARLVSAQALNQFLLNAHMALKAHGVDFMSLPEWQDQTEIDEALTLKNPMRAQDRIVSYIGRMENALSAAVRRKQMRLTVRTFDNGKGA